MPSQAQLLEALSAVSGCNVQLATGAAHTLTPQDFVNVVALKEFYTQEGLQALEYPNLGTLSLQDMGTTTTLALPESDSAPTNRPTVYVNAQEFFDPGWNYDFTNVKDGETVFTRGKEPYLRPCGWFRAAIKVLKKYPDGDAWLGTGDEAWPVSYHGSAMDGSLGIIVTRKKAKGDEDGDDDGGPGERLAAGSTLGRGVYSTPDVKTAGKFSKTFRSREDNKVYKVVLQNRINPEQRQKCRREKYWLVYVPEGSTAIQERAIIEGALRPYGLLLQQV
ncbi:uncharacterized protein [Osmerus mordax]|uniref:uncharacterized protein isoform X2 n=1 Tax=Osmerus mordax TaxID=8014 RepID=UPI00350FD7B8